VSLGVEVSFPTGRRVRLEQLHILPTRTDWTEVSRPRQMEDRIPDLVVKLFGTEIPCVVRNFGGSSLPWTCLGLFASAPMVRYSVTVADSLLVVCWFTQEVGVPVQNLVCEGLSGLDWEAHAKDFHSDW
jgi:hypothetical protein